MRKTGIEINGKDAAVTCLVADSYFSRFLGLMGKKEIAPRSAICFPKCNSIHTLFMRFPIDVVMVGSDGTVVKIVEAMKPWRLILPEWKAKHVIEMRAQECRSLGITEGSRVTCKGVWN